MPERDGGDDALSSQLVVRTFLVLRGFHELTAYAAGALALVLLWALGKWGLVIPRPLWVLAVAMGLAGLLGFVSANYYERNPTPMGASVYLFAQCVSVTIVIYLIGWGPALGIAYAYPIFNTPFPPGGPRRLPLIAWPTVSVLLGQLLVSAGLVTLMIGDTKASNGLAVLDVAAFAFIAIHATQLAAGRESAEHDLAFAAGHDALTGIANRATFVYHLERAVSRRGHDGLPMAILFCDLMGFKQVNDQFGHDAGDAVIVEVARRIQAATRHDDLVARFGGDEFVIELASVSTREGAEAAASRLLAAMQPCFELGLDQARVGVSIGIAFCEVTDVSAEELLKAADAAMYQAKASGQSAFVTAVV